MALDAYSGLYSILAECYLKLPKRAEDGNASKGGLLPSYPQAKLGRSCVQTTIGKGVMHTLEQSHLELSCKA